MVILGIETSCDDTCASLVKATGRKNPKFKILSNVRSSQIDIHQEFGGVVPHLAARAHVENMNPVLKKAFREAGVTLADGEKMINLIAVTSHPGLIPCLLIGTNVARTLAWVWKKPILGVNHLEGHIYANWINPIRVNSNSPPQGGEARSTMLSGKFQTTKINFPAICLVVSGGHTQLVLMRGHGDFRIIGETRDDAAGEAFDKIAKLLGLPFPGGPPIAAYAAKHKSQITNHKQITNEFEITLPRPMINSKNYDFSFSGLKTAVLYLVQDLQKEYPRRSKKSLYPIPYTLYPQICAEFQQAIIDVLVAKTIRAAKQYNAKTIILGGGVAANKELRKQLGQTIKEKLPDTQYLMPEIQLAVDNAAMIAIAGYFDYLAGKSKTWRDIKARAVL